MTYNIDKFNQAMSIPYISECHPSFANYILGALQESIRNSIRNGSNDISSVEIANAINKAYEYSQYFRKSELAAK